MKDCKGILGKLFGHKLESFIVYRSGLQGKVEIPGGVSEYFAEQTMEKMREVKYEVICKRCGDHVATEIR